MKRSLLDHATFDPFAGLFGEFFDFAGPSARTHRSAALNAWVGKDDAKLSLEAPGVDPASIDVSIEADVLTIRGSRPLEELAEGETRHRHERFHGDFERSVRLPFRVDPSKVEAAYERGLLEVTLPRAESDKPRKIQVSAAKPVEAPKGE
ncbi:MAG: Hsp20/alpha crystallin family protein [Planctomycetota bacterium]